MYLHCIYNVSVRVGCPIFGTSRISMIIILFTQFVQFQQFHKLPRNSKHSNNFPQKSDLTARPHSHFPDHSQHNTHKQLTTVTNGSQRPTIKITFFQFLKHTHLYPKSPLLPSFPIPKTLQNSLHNHNNYVNP